MRAGRIAFLAGDGVASADGGEGKKIVFQIQAADDAPNLSDSDPLTPDKDPVAAEISIVYVISVASGESVPINADKLLTPEIATLTAWKGSTVSGGLAVVVKLFGQESGDVLSLGVGYDTNKITPQWNGATGELSLGLAAGATESDIRTALGLLELKTALASSDSARRIWIFPTLSGVSGFRYRVDESAGLVRYYFYDGTDRTFSAASTEAAGRSLFGKSGYLGVFTSEAEKTIYKALWKADMHVAITDVTTEGKWVITAGPRQGQVLWDHTATKFGPGAEGSGWSTRTSFWYDKEPDDWTNSGRNPDGEDYAIIYRSNRLVQDVFDGSRNSISHHDFLVSEQEILTRKITVVRAPPNPILDVSLDDLQTTAQRPLILTENHISVVDLDTRDPLDASKVDASKIKLRVTNIVDGTLKRLTSTPSAWVDVDLASGTQYREFSLAQLQGGLIAFFPNADASTLTFDIQAHDGTHLSDSDPDTDGTQPAPVSIRVVALKEVEAGQKVALNDDSPRGALTPDAVTLQAWIDADSTLEIFLELQGAKSGIVVPEEGDVAEFLSLSGSVSNITATWDAGNDRLSLQGSASATVGNFEAALGALQLQTVRFKDDSTRTISVSPNVAGDVPKKDFYVREVKVGASPIEPLLSVRGFTKRLATAERYLVLTESHLSVDDVDTVLSNGDIDASRITFRVSDVVGGTLQERTSASADWVGMTEEALNGSPLGYYAFTLADLQGGLVSVKASAGVSSFTFKVQATDDGDPGVSNSPPHLSDSDRNDNQNDADPASVSISVVALKEIEAGQKGALNDDRPRGGLTPDPVTLQAWLDAESTLEIFVELQKGKSGIVVLEEGDVEEVLSLSAAAPNITATWDGTNDRLSLQGTTSATVSDFEAALAALQLQTVRFKDDSYRTISVSPNISGDVPNKDFYVREVKVGASPTEPLLSVRFGRLRVNSGQRLILGEEHILVDDVDTRDVDDNVDASKDHASDHGIDRRRAAKPLFELGKRLGQDSCRSSESVLGVHACGPQGWEDIHPGGKRDCKDRWWRGRKNHLPGAGCGRSG